MLIISEIEKEIISISSSTNYTASNYTSTSDNKVVFYTLIRCSYRDNSSAANKRGFYSLIQVPIISAHK